MFKRLPDGSIFGTLMVLCAFAVIHSCLYQLDLNTPADPRSTTHEQSEE